MPPNSRFLMNLILARQNEATMNSIVADVDALSREIGRNALLSASSRYFVSEQNAPPAGPIPVRSLPPGDWAGGGDFAKVSQNYVAAMGSMNNGNSSAKLQSGLNAQAAQLAEEHEKRLAACRNVDSKACREIREQLDACGVQADQAGCNDYLKKILHAARRN